jgi:hypothetical protein
MDAFSLSISMNRRTGIDGVERGEQRRCGFDGLATVANQEPQLSIVSKVTRRACQRDFASQRSPGNSNRWSAERPAPLPTPSPEFHAR